MELEEILTITNDGYTLQILANTPARFLLPTNAAGESPRAVRIMPVDQFGTAYIKFGDDTVEATTGSILVRGIESIVLNTAGNKSFSVLALADMSLNIVPLEV